MSRPRPRPATGITPPLNQKRTNSGVNEYSKIPRAAYSNATSSKSKSSTTKNNEDDIMRQHTKVIELTIDNYDEFSPQQPTRSKTKSTSLKENPTTKSNLPKDNNSAYNKASTKTKTPSTRPMTTSSHEIRSNKTPRQFDKNFSVGSQPNMPESSVNTKVSFSSSVSASNTSNLNSNDLNYNLNSSSTTSSNTTTKKTNIHRTSSRQAHLQDNAPPEVKSKPSRPQTAVPKGSRKVIQVNEEKKPEKHREEEDENYGMSIDDVKLEWMDDLDKLQAELNDNVRKTSFIHPNLESSVIKAGIGAESKLTENSTEHDAIEEANRIIEEGFAEFQKEFDEEGDLIDRRIQLLTQIQQTLMEHSAYDYTADQMVDDDDADFDDDDNDFEKPKVEPRRAKTAAVGTRSRPKY